MKHSTFTGTGVCERILQMAARLVAWLQKTESARPPGDAILAAAVVAAQHALCKGEINLDDYLTIKIDALLEPLEALLLPEDLALVRSMLRAQIENSPAWSRLVVDLGKAASRRSRAH